MLFILGALFYFHFYVRCCCCFLFWTVRVKPISMNSVQKSRLKSFRTLIDKSKPETENTNQFAKLLFFLLFRSFGKIFVCDFLFVCQHFWKFHGPFYQIDHVFLHCSRFFIFFSWPILTRIFPPKNKSTQTKNSTEEKRKIIRRI